jgi:phage-related minor tail protein
MFETFLAEYGTQIIYTVLTAIIGAIGTWVGTLYKKYINDKTKESVVKTCVKAVEQIYNDLHGEEKYNKAVEAITEMLNEKNITISEFEIKMLIEASCSEFVKGIKNSIEKSSDESEAE